MFILLQCRVINWSPKVSAQWDTGWTNKQQVTSQSRTKYFRKLSTSCLFLETKVVKSHLSRFENYTKTYPVTSMAGSLLSWEVTSQFQSSPQPPVYFSVQLDFKEPVQMVVHVCQSSWKGWQKLPTAAKM